MLFRSESLGITEISIKDGRVYSGEKLFSELSEGQRYAIIIPIAARLIRKDQTKRAIIVIRQEAWASLQPRIKWAIHKLAISLRINILTAVCTDEPRMPGVAFVNYGDIAAAAISTADPTPSLL